MKIRMKAEGRFLWNFILQKGFYLSTFSGMTVRQFMVETMKFENSFVDNAVRTVFLNSRPVDDIDGAVLRAGDCVALGSAMPGLVGICMGRDNPYKEFRSGIAAESMRLEGARSEEITVLVKVFSTLAVETGTDLLEQGIRIKTHDLTAFLEKNSAYVMNWDSELCFRNTSDVEIQVEFIE